MYGKLSRIESSNQNLRTKTVEGEFEKYPTIGENFDLIGKSLSPLGDFRLVSTSTVLGVMQVGKLYTFDTMYSRYELDVYDDKPPLEESLT